METHYRQPAPSPQPSKFEQFWDFIVEVHPSVTDAVMRRKARLLAALCFGLPMAILLVVAFMALSRPEILDDLDTLMFFAVGGLIFLAYFMVRAGHYFLPAFVLVGLSALISIIAPFVPGSSERVLVVSIIPILLAGVVYSPRIAIYLSIFTNIALMSLTYLRLAELEGGTRYFDVIYSLIVANVAILIFMFQVRAIERIRKSELEEAIVALRESERQLELRVEERTRELEAALKQAEEANNVKSAFLASMSHELRTPLNAIINFSKFLQKGIPGPVNEEQGQLAGSIADSGQHLLSLINDVLDMSKIESGSLNLYIESGINMRQIIETAVQYALPLLTDKPVELLQELPDDLPLVRGDRKRLLQVCLNILSNACKFTEKGFVKIRVQDEKEHLLVSVEDTGQGIASEDASAVFTAFKQTESGLRQGGSGTGLGMPISQKLLEAHHGRIWFTSQVNVGTTFYFELPLQTELKG